MEQKSKRADAVICNTLREIIEFLNKEKIPKEDIVNIFNNGNKFILIFYI